MSTERAVEEVVLAGQILHMLVAYVSIAVIVVALMAGFEPRSQSRQPTVEVTVVYVDNVVVDLLRLLVEAGGMMAGVAGTKYTGGPFVTIGGAPPELLVADVCANAIEYQLLSDPVRNFY